MKFKIDGRDYEGYQLNNKQVLQLLKSETITPEEKDYLMKSLIDRFDYAMCPKEGENDDDVFVRFFSNFVNGRMYRKDDVANLMAREHRYLQQQMFGVCMAYIKKLSENFEKGYYDGRNEYSCQTSNKIINALKEMNWPY